MSDNEALAFLFLGLPLMSLYLGLMLRLFCWSAGIHY